MDVLGAIVGGSFLMFVGTAIGVATVRNRKPKTADSPKRGGRKKGKGREGGGRKGSLLVTAWNASGAPKVKSKRVSHALAELTGRGVGNLTRRAKGRVTGRVERLRDWVKSLDDKPVPWERFLPMVRRSKGGDPPESPATPKPDPTPVKSAPPAPGAGGPTPKPSSKPAAPAATAPKPAPTGGSVTTPDTTGDMTDAVIAGADVPAPSWFLPVLNHIQNFTPASDTELMDFGREITAGLNSMASNIEDLADRCVDGVGLDPTSVDGITEFSTSLSYAASSMRTALKRFVSVYRAMIDMVASGIRAPFNGRFFTGQN